MDDAQRDPREFLSRVLYHPISDCKRVRSFLQRFFARPCQENNPRRRVELIELIHNRFVNPHKTLAKFFSDGAERFRCRCERHRKNL